MKRSEMVDLICRAIQEKIGGHYTSFDEHAEAALQACEKEGMLPPKRVTSGVIPLSLKATDIDMVNAKITFGPSYGIYEISEWEHENEA